MNADSTASLQVISPMTGKPLLQDFMGLPKKSWISRPSLYFDRKSLTL